MYWCTPAWIVTNKHQSSFACYFFFARTLVNEKSLIRLSVPFRIFKTGGWLDGLPSSGHSAWAKLFKSIESIKASNTRTNEFVGMELSRLNINNRFLRMSKDDFCLLHNNATPWFFHQEWTMPWAIHKCATLVTIRNPIHRFFVPGHFLHAPHWPGWC